MPRNVVRSATYPELSPAISPPAWISRCAGVQNVSRPIDMCHEMSQYTPTITHAAANTAVYACQRDDGRRRDSCWRRERLTWLECDCHGVC